MITSAPDNQPRRLPPPVLSLLRTGATPVRPDSSAGATPNRRVVKQVTPSRKARTVASGRTLKSPTLPDGVIFKSRLDIQAESRNPRAAPAAANTELSASCWRISDQRLA